MGKVFSFKDFCYEGIRFGVKPLYLFCQHGNIKVPDASKTQPSFNIRFEKFFLPDLVNFLAIPLITLPEFAHNTFNFLTDLLG